MSGRIVVCQVELVYVRSNCCIPDRIVVSQVELLYTRSNCCRSGRIVVCQVELLYVSRRLSFVLEDRQTT